MKLKPGSLPVFTWKSLGACILWARWTFNKARTSEILVFLQHSAPNRSTLKYFLSFLSILIYLPMFLTQRTLPAKLGFINASKPSTNPHNLAPVTKHVLTANSFFGWPDCLFSNNAKGACRQLLHKSQRPGPPFPILSPSIWWKTWAGSSCSSDGTERLPYPLATRVGH